MAGRAGSRLGESAAGPDGTWKARAVELLTLGSAGQGRDAALHYCALKAGRY